MIKECDMAKGKKREKRWITLDPHSWPCQFLWLHILDFVCVHHACLFVPQHVCEGQRTTYKESVLSLLQMNPGAWHQVVRIGHRYLYSLRPLPTEPSNHWAIWPLSPLITVPSHQLSFLILITLLWKILDDAVFCTCTGVLPHTHSSMPCRANSITETCFDLDLWWNQQTGGPLKGWGGEEGRSRSEVYLCSLCNRINWVCILVSAQTHITQPE